MRNFNIDTRDMTNRKWGETAALAFREDCDRLMGIALSVPQDVAEIVWDYADVFDTLAYQIENILDSGSHKKQSRQISAFRRIYNDGVLNALADMVATFAECAE